SEGLQPYLPDYWRLYFEIKAESDPPSSSLAPAPKTQAQVVEAARLLQQVRPRFPEEAKAFLLDGTVFIETEIKETGDVRIIRIQKPAGAGLDEAAVEAVRQWKYKPALLDGKPVPVFTMITVNFAFS